VNAHGGLLGRDVVLEARDVSYRRCGAASVRRVSLAVVRGELLAVCGPPGSGTSTLLALLGGCARPDAGRIVRRGATPLLARGCDSAWAALDGADERSVLLLDHPSAPDDAEDAVLDAARRTAARGAAVVVTTHDLELAAMHAQTAALMVAGRLIAWADPAQAFVPAVRLLGYSTTPADSLATRA
jgi:ABC-type hemin transport system ATPase subunit